MVGSLVVRLGLVLVVATGCGSLSRQAATTNPADAASVTCSSDGVSAPATMDTLADGVRFSALSTPDDSGSEQLFIVLYDRLDGALNESFGTTLTPGVPREIVAPIPPGLVRMGCFEPPYAEQDVTDAEVAKVEVVDSGGFWGPIELGCATSDLEGLLWIKGEMSKRSSETRASKGWRHRMSSRTRATETMRSTGCIRSSDMVKHWRIFTSPTSRGTRRASPVKPARTRV